MKKTIFLIATATLLMMAASCGQSSSSIEFKTIEVSEFVKHPKATGDMQGMEYNISFTYPSRYGNKAVLATLQRSFVSDILGGKYASLTPEKAVNALIEDWKEGYNNDMEGFVTENPDYIPYYAYIISNIITLTTDRLLQYKAEGYWHEGGAHGFGGKWGALFDLQTGQEYSRDNIFNSQAADAIHRLLLREIYAIAYENCNCNEVFIDHDAVWTEDVGFAVTHDGIFFLYSDYELGSNALGIHEVFIPYNQILPHLRQGTPVWDLAKEKNIEAVGSTLTISITSLTTTFFGEKTFVKGERWHYEDGKYIPYDSD